MPPGEPEGTAAEIRELTTRIITSLAASNPTLVNDFAKAFAGDVAVAQEYLAYSAELSSGKPTVAKPEPTVSLSELVHEAKSDPNEIFARLVELGR